MKSGSSSLAGRVRPEIMPQMRRNIEIVCEGGGARARAEQWLRSQGREQTERKIYRIFFVMGEVHFTLRARMTRSRYVRHGHCVDLFRPERRLWLWSWGYKDRLYLTGVYAMANSHRDILFNCSLMSYFIKTMNSF